MGRVRCPTVAHINLHQLASTETTEDRVDDIIALGGVEVVVPLLSASAMQLDDAQRYVEQGMQCLPHDAL